MLNKTLPLLSCLIFSGFALAQVPAKIVGSAVNVQGLVTESNGTQVAGVVEGKPVVDGARYVTSSTGSVTLNFGRCEVKLKPNQLVTVDERKICDGMIAAIETLPGAGLALAGGAFSGGDAALVGLSLVAGAAILGGGSGGAAVIGDGGGGPIPNLCPSEPCPSGR